MYDTEGLEVKFNDPFVITWCESCTRGRICRWGTKVRGSKMIRYRCSSDYKRFRLEIPAKPFPRLLGNPRETKFLESRGSIIASLKLKRIDGKAPPWCGFCGLIWLNTEKLTKFGHKYDWQAKDLSWFCDRWCMAILSSWIDLSC